MVNILWKCVDILVGEYVVNPIWKVYAQQK